MIVSRNMQLRISIFCLFLFSLYLGSAEDYPDNRITACGHLAKLSSKNVESLNRFISTGCG